MAAPIRNAVCGPQVPGAASSTAAHTHGPEHAAHGKDQHCPFRVLERRPELPQDERRPDGHDKVQPHTFRLCRYHARGPPLPGTAPPRADTAGYIPNAELDEVVGSKGGDMQTWMPQLTNLIVYDGLEWAAYTDDHKFQLVRHGGVPVVGAHSLTDFYHGHMDGFCTCHQRRRLSPVRPHARRARAAARPCRAGSSSKGPVSLARRNSKKVHRHRHICTGKMTRVDGVDGHSGRAPL